MIRAPRNQNKRVVSGAVILFQRDTSEISDTGGRVASGVSGGDVAVFGQVQTRFGSQRAAARAPDAPTGRRPAPIRMFDCATEAAGEARAAPGDERGKEL
jgi:hypothetical protein